MNSFLKRKGSYVLVNHIEDGGDWLEEENPIIVKTFSGGNFIHYTRKKIYFLNSSWTHSILVRSNRKETIKTTVNRTPRRKTFTSSFKFVEVQNL